MYTFHHNSVFIYANKQEQVDQQDTTGTEVSKNRKEKKGIN